MAYMTVCIIAALVALGQVVWESWASVVHRAGFDLCEINGLFWDSIDNICDDVSITRGLKGGRGTCVCGGGGTECLNEDYQGTPHSYSRPIHAVGRGALA